MIIARKLSSVRVFLMQLETYDRFCGLVSEFPGYRSRDPGFDSWRYQIFQGVVGL
jgi:hypothetical protein